MSYVVDELHKLGQMEIGVAENPKGSNRTKFGVYWDTPKSKNGPYPWFNGKKNGQCGWCSLYTNWEIVMVLIPLLGNADKVRQWLGYPKPSENAAAGCPEMYSYLKKWKVAKNKGQAGDIIFLNTIGTCSHVGRIDKVENGKYYTVEGNKGDKVGTGEYSINSTKIYAVIHPPYDTLEPKPEPQPTPEPQPHPEPPTPQPVTTAYKVKTITGAPLALRVAPKQGSQCIAWMPNGSSVTVDKTVTGEMVYGSKTWAHATYKGMTGYCTLTRLKKV